MKIVLLSLLAAMVPIRSVLKRAFGYLAQMLFRLQRQKEFSTFASVGAYMRVRICAQQSGQETIAIDDLHGFRVEYVEYFDYDEQKVKDVVLFVSETQCYIVLTSDKDWKKSIGNSDDLYFISDEIYAQIKDNRDIITLTEEQAIEEYSRKILERWQCRDKKVFKLLYTPEV